MNLGGAWADSLDAEVTAELNQVNKLLSQCVVKKNLFSFSSLPY
jgi:hypothetical protein